MNAWLNENVWWINQVINILLKLLGVGALSLVVYRLLETQ